MAISASGMYGLTIEKAFKSTLAADVESETAMYVMMVTDSYTPAFDTHAFQSDVTNEVSGTGYTAGGNVLTTTEVTVGSPAAGQLKYDTADPQWLTSTITSAMGAIVRSEIGVNTTDELLMLSDFVTAASTTAGTFDIVVDPNGWFYLDYTP